MIDNEKQSIYVKEEIRTCERIVIKTITYMTKREMEEVQRLNFEIVRNLLTGKEIAEGLVFPPDVLAISPTEGSNPKEKHNS